MEVKSFAVCKKLDPPWRKCNSCAMRRLSLILLAAAFWDCKTIQQPAKPETDNKPRPITTEAPVTSEIDRWVPEPAELLSEKPETDDASLAIVRQRMRDFVVRNSINANDDLEFSSYSDHTLEPKELEFLEKTATSDPKPGRQLLAVEILAQSRLLKGDFAGAAGVWKTHRIPGYERHTQALIKILEGQTEVIELQNFGSPVNSDQTEYDAVPDLSDKRIYFTRYDHEKKMSDPPGEDIWIAEKKSDGSWGARPLSELNTPSHDSVVSASADGSSLYLFGHYPGSLGSGDIFKSTLTAKGWSKPVPLPPPINSAFFDSDAVETPNGKAIIFASDRPGGYYPYHPKQQEFYGGGRAGNVDLYISFVKPDGSYTLPRNLGPVINTPGSDRNPYLHADGKTLYFSSDGHPGLGGHDVFRSVRLDDTWQKWTEPENIGRYVNGPGNDTGFRLNAHGTQGLISGSHKDTHGPSDIYRIMPIPVRAKPAEEVSLLRGYVKDQKGQPVEADVAWKKKGEKESEGKAKSRADTGEYVLPLAQNKTYDIQVSKPGFFEKKFEVQTPPPEKAAKTPDLDIPIVIKKDPAYKPTERDMAKSDQKAEPVEPRVIVRPSPAKPPPARVHFSIGGFQIQNPDALTPTLTYLKQNPKSRIMIEAHADSTGNAAFNRQLSERRARAVYQYFVSRGISPTRVAYRGIGARKPAATNRTGVGRKINRRAIVRILP